MSTASGNSQHPPVTPPKFWQQLLASRHLLWIGALLAVVLCLGALDHGWQIDDYMHQAALLGVDGFEEFERPFWRLFAFVDEQSEPQKAIELGFWPWWTASDLKLSFLRPVSGLSHWIDHHLWPEAPWAMHLHSLVWLGLMVAAVGSLYRAIEGPTWVAGLAVLLFAVDEAHGVPAAWIANRNALLAAFFGVLALLAHHRGRQGWRWGSALSCVALLAAVLSNEGAVAVGGYLLAYALCLETGTWKQRLLSLLPTATTGAVWWMTFKALGYGTRGSAVYIDPGTDPGRFLLAVWERAPLLVLGQWTPLPSDVVGLMNASTARLFWLGAALCVVVLGWLLWPLCRRDRRARFWALGMGLSILPVCATFPSNRLLTFVGIGAMGLLARWASSLAAPRESRPGRPRRMAVWALLVVHLLLAPWILWASLDQQHRLFAGLDQMASSLPSDAAVAQQTLVVVNSPSAFLAGYGFLRMASRGALPRQARLLSASIYPTELERPEAQTLILRPRGGLLLPAGHGEELGIATARFDLRYFLQLMDHLFRDVESPFEVGDTVRLEGLDIEVLEVTDGRAMALSYRFTRPLDDPAWRWVAWQGERFEPFELPEVGQRVSLEGLERPLTPR